MKYAAGVFLLWFALAGLGCREKQNSYEETESGAAQAMEECWVRASGHGTEDQARMPESGRGVENFT